MVVTDQRERTVLEPPDRAPCPWESEPWEPEPWEPQATIEPLVLLVVLAAVLVLCAVAAGALLLSIT
jgi:hypothetical protein